MAQRTRSSRLPERIRLGISSCLLGEPVRYDGNHKRDAYITGVLEHHVELVPVCPEVAVGLGVPRQPIRLVGDPRLPRAVGADRPDVDVTDALRGHGHRIADELAHISGYILKSKSPSCGIAGVKVFTGGGVRRGTGVYADALMAARPTLPVMEETGLADAALRDPFIERVFAYRRWQDLVAAGLTADALVQFHGDHKLQLMAHDKRRCRELGHLAARAGSERLDPLAQRYIRDFMTALCHPATRRRHTDVLFLILGCLRRHLERTDEAELVALIEGYRQGHEPLSVPVTRLRHHFRHHPDPCMDRQVYLHPHPVEHRLRGGP